MSPVVATSTPPNMPAPLGPYSHIARAGQFITISAIAAMDPASGNLVGTAAYAQAKQILRLCSLMLTAAGTDFAHVVHVNLFLKNMDDYDEVNRAFAEGFVTGPPACTVAAMADLPKVGALLTMSLTAIAST